MKNLDRSKNKKIDWKKLRKNYELEICDFCKFGLENNEDCIKCPAKIRDKYANLYISSLTKNIKSPQKDKEFEDMKQFTRNMSQHTLENGKERTKPSEIKSPLRTKGQQEDSSNKELWSEEIVNCNWKDTFLYAKKLNREKHLGRTNWRVPKLWKLLKAYDEKIPGFTASWFWSSSGFSDGSLDAWYVSFSTGYAYSNYKSSATHVRCVSSETTITFDEARSKLRGCGKGENLNEKLLKSREEDKLLEK